MSSFHDDAALFDDIAAENRPQNGESRVMKSRRPPIPPKQKEKTHMSRNDRPARSAQHPMLSFKEFVTERLGGSESTPGDGLSEQVANPRNISNPLPVLLTFQRKQMVRFSDGKIVGIYKELRTGQEIVFPNMF